MTDISTWLRETHREIGQRTDAAGRTRSVVLRRRYDAEIEDVWDACTDPDRIKRWFLPVSGDLRLGGKYQLEGNAGGEILRCEAPRLLSVTWVYGEGAGDVELRLARGRDGGTDFELEHGGVPEDGAAANLLGVGVGWDPALVALGMYVRGETIPDPSAWEESEELQQFAVSTTRAWGAAVEAAGAGTAAEVAAAVDATIEFYAPKLASAKKKED